MDEHGDLHLHYRLEPIRSRRMASLEAQMRELLFHANEFKAATLLAQMQVEAYQMGLATLKDSFKIDIN
jgi:hypothetical protein